MPQKPISSAPIRDELAREHIPYEIAMMRRIHNLLTAGVTAGFLRNALIEAFALHARALIEFFLGKSGSDAKHFTTSSYVPFKHKPDLPVEKLNQQVAHITERRETDSSKKLNGDDIDRLRSDLDLEVNEFMSHLTSHFRNLWDAHKQL